MTGRGKGVPPSGVGSIKGVGGPSKPPPVAQQQNKPSPAPPEQSKPPPKPPPPSQPPQKNVISAPVAATNNTAPAAKKVIVPSPIIKPSPSPFRTGPQPPSATNPNTQGVSLFTTIFGTAMFANKWQKAMNEDRQAKIVEMFTIPRNDPNDVYKPNSAVETQTLAEQPYSKPLSDERIAMLHEIAINYDYGCQLDVIESFRPNTFVSHESREQLSRLPSWLRFLILMRYDQIHAKFEHHTHHFIKEIANYVETRRTTTGTGAEHMEHEHDGAMDEDDVDESEIFDRYTLEVGDIVPPSRPTIAPLDEEDDDMDRPTKQGQKNRPTLVKHARFSGGEAEPEDSELKAIMEKDDLFKVKTAAWKWKLPTTLEQDWEPSTVHRAATTLRRALLTQPLPSEIAMVAEDEKLAKNEKGMMKREGDDDDELEQGTVADSDRFKKPSWEDIIGTNLTFKEEIAEKVEEDLHRIPKGLKQHEREEEERLAGLVTNKRDQFVSPKPKSWIERIKNSDYMKRREEIKKKNKDLQDKAPSRKYSNIWVKNCPMEPVKQAKRFPHHYRCDESFHAYVVALVGSSFFKSFIMVAIVVNAVSLAVETGEVKTYHVVFDILDNLFLSIYLVEFLLKVYAHPYRYWTSGFNLFDFAILAVSLLNSILVWTKVDNLPALKLLVIFRALRILRGISMSVQIQVLITALVETLKTHVLSVLILLFLLMYITAIIAYYFFSPSEGLNHPWGNILKGMLRLFSFVTLDGWTDTSEEFERAGYTHSGRVFCLVCILLGNFLISNIFIAIIIMQISEATEAFRTRERDEREEIITLKKEIVFRRQKLDMRQLLAKQTVSTNADFYYLGSQFLKLLRHDDLVEMNNAQFSPLWMDSFYKSEMRCHHTANVLMNLHRQMADNLLTMYRKNMESRYSVTPIRRSRYNRYMKLKSKLAIIRQEFFRDMSSKKKPRQLRVNIGKSEFPQISKQLLDHAAWENVAKSGGGTGVNQDARKMLPTVDEEDEQAVDKEEQQEDNNDDDEEDMANRFPT